MENFATSRLFVSQKIWYVFILEYDICMLIHSTSYSLQYSDKLWRTEATIKSVFNSRIRCRYQFNSLRPPAASAIFYVQAKWGFKCENIEERTRKKWRIAFSSSHYHGERFLRFSTLHFNDFFHSSQSSLSFHRLTPRWYYCWYVLAKSSFSLRNNSEFRVAFIFRTAFSFPSLHAIPISMFSILVCIFSCIS